MDLNSVVVKLNSEVSVFFFKRKIKPLSRVYHPTPPTDATLHPAIAKVPEPKFNLYKKPSGESSDFKPQENFKSIYHLNQLFRQCMFRLSVIYLNFYGGSVPIFFSFCSNVFLVSLHKRCVRFGEWENARKEKREQACACVV